MVPPASAVAPIPVGRLFLAFLRLGANAFGGPAMVPYVRRRVVGELRWMDENRFRSGLALCQALPGATTMQLAGWIGLSLGGVAGAAASFVAFGLPAVCSMLAIAAAYQRWGQHDLAVAAFSGLHPVVVAVMVHATVTFGRATLRSWRAAIVAGVSAALLAVGVHPVGALLVAGVLGATAAPRNQPPAATSTARTATRTGRAVLALLGMAAACVAALHLVAPDLAEISVTMGRIDLFAFGGGFASVPLLHREVIAHRWMTPGAFLDGIAAGQVSPGPVVITATFVGVVAGGLRSGLAATIGIFLPSFVVLLIAAPRMDRLRSFGRFDAIVSGLAASFVGMLAWSAVSFAREIPWDPVRGLLFIGTSCALLAGVEIAWIVLAAAPLGALLLR